MKTITIKQPWGYLICSGIKDIENRTWATKVRGRVLVYVSQGKKFKINLTDDQMLAAFGSISEQATSGKFDFGAIIGSVEILDCVANHPSVWAEKAVEYNPDIHEFAPRMYNWVLTNPVLFLEPISAKGKQRFWDYPNIHAEPEEKDGELFCNCQLPVDERIQVSGDSRFGYHCRYCGGKWYK
ncbi:MAG: ASCH domain-containing protein [Paludibacter sp.]|nr:ASCH domain-containing protein [Paludibacter sp.]